MPFFGALVGIALLMGGVAALGKPGNTGTAMIVAGALAVAGVAGLGYLFAAGTNYLNPKVIFVIIIVGFILSDRSLWPNRRR